VTATPSAKAMTCVQLTRTPLTSKLWFELGRFSDRALSLQTHDIVPSRISANPSDAVALTSGSRAASGGPNSSP
jgi:hypothetical protein